MFGLKTEGALREFESTCAVCLADGRIERGASSPEWQALQSAATPLVDIAGRYYLDAGASRFLTLVKTGRRSYSIESVRPDPWPLSDTITWVEDDRYEGDAVFDSGSRIRVVVTRLGDGRLDTEFRYVTDDTGNPTDRVDPHQLVPVG
jgi:hypothetical protein